MLANIPLVDIELHKGARSFSIHAAPELDEASSRCVTWATVDTRRGILKTLTPLALAIWYME